MDSRISESSSTSVVNSVLHAVKILECYSSQREEYLSLTEICQATNMRKGTVHRFLKTLQSVEWIEQSDVNGKYRLGTGILLLVSAVSVHHTARSLILEEMRKLSELHNETVGLSTLCGNTGICVELLQSRHRFSSVQKKGHMVPLHIGADGKTLLAVQPPHIIERILAEFPEEFARKLRIQLEEIQQTRYCISENEIDMGVTAIAVPLSMMDATYSLNISGPAERMQHLGYEILNESLQEAAERICQKEKAL